MLCNLGYDTRKATKKALHILKSSIGHNNWIISGSFANTRIQNPGDIDVFFHTKKDYEDAMISIGGSKNFTNGIATPNTYTFYNDWDMPCYQFIHKTTGTAQELFDQFDLNVCKYGILPNGNRIRDITATHKIMINRLTGDTFKRYFKYMDYLNVKNMNYEHERDLIDKYIGDTTLIEDFYDGKVIKSPVNATLFKEIKKRGQPLGYLNQKAREYAPELLL